MDAKTLADLEAIKQLKARYFRFLDTKAWEEWGNVFTEDARLQWGPEDSQVMEGREAIVATVSAALDGAVSVHHGHMPEIELLGGGRARGVWAMHDRIDHPAYQLRGYGHYHEEYREQDGEWRIHRTTLTRLTEERGRT